MAWHLDDPVRWRREQEIALEMLGGVSCGFDYEDRAFIRGELRIAKRYGGELGPFVLRIVYPLGFPKLGITPHVYLENQHEVWQRDSESHLESDWKACLFVPGEAEIDFSRRESLRLLIERAAVFFRLQGIHQREVKREWRKGIKVAWPGPERRHGDLGVMDLLREKGKLGRNEACPCGSGKKYKQCHGEAKSGRR